MSRPLAITQSPLITAKAGNAYLLKTVGVHLKNTGTVQLKIRQDHAAVAIDGQQAAENADTSEWFFLPPGRETDQTWDLDQPVALGSAKTVAVQMTLEYDEAPSTGFRISDVTITHRVISLADGKYDTATALQEHDAP